MVMSVCENNNEFANLSFNDLPFEEKVCRLRDKGNTYKEMAERLNVSVGKVNTTIAKLIRSGKIKKKEGAPGTKGAKAKKVENKPQQKEVPTLESLMHGLSGVANTTEEISTKHKEMLIELLHGVFVR